MSKINSGLLILLIFLQIHFVSSDELDCSLDPSSTGELLDNGECQCIQLFYWNNLNQRCEANCKQQLAIQPNPQNPLTCICRCPAFWDEKLKRCALECLQIQFSTGQSEEINVCQCKPISNWNPLNINCDLQCKRVPRSTGQIVDYNKCQCEVGFVWDEDSETCMRVCQADKLNTGNNVNYEICECTNIGRWDLFLEKCVSISCGQIAYAIGPTEDQQNCICQDNFKWSRQQHMCILDCQNIYNPLGQPLNLNSYQCQCLSGAQWNQEALICNRNCSLIIDSTGKNVNSQQCQCQKGFVWQEDKCVTRCNQVGQSGEFDQTRELCLCKQGFQYSLFSSGCYLKCQEIPFASNSNQQESFTTCQCDRGYKWVQSSLKCQLQCNGPFDTGNIINDDVQEQVCQCKPNSLYNTRNKMCGVLCTEDPLSTGKFDNQKNQCFCNVNAEWSSETIKCTCLQGFEYNSDSQSCILPSLTNSQGTGAVIGISVAVTSILSGIGVAGGIKLYQKKRKNSKEDDIVDIPDMKKSQSVQDFHKGVEKQEI